MECQTDPVKKRAYQWKLWLLFLGNVALFALGCAAMGGAKHRFYKIWKVSDYQVKRNSIEIRAYVWYAEKVMARDSLPVKDGCLGDVSGLFAQAERCQREFALRRTLEKEEAIVAMLQSRKEEAACG